MCAALLLAGCGDTGNTSAPEPPGGASDEPAVVVEDVTGHDADDAQTTLDDLEVEFVAGGEDDDIDAPRNDVAGCEVVDQDPSPGVEVAIGDDVTLGIDCRTVDWENQEGDEWDAFSSAFEDAYTTGCEALFDLSPDGSLHEDGTEYSNVDCPATADAADDPPPDVPDDPAAAGEETGFDAGCQALFDDAGITELYHGTDTFTAEDCQDTNPHRAVPASSGSTNRPQRRSTPRAAKDPVTGTCVGTHKDGSRFRITDPAGDVRCAGAKALWVEFLRRAPTEGVGSGGAVDGIDGWGCLAAPAATAAKRLGSCSRKGTGTSFSVVPAA